MNPGDRVISKVSWDQHLEIEEGTIVRGLSGRCVIVRWDSMEYRVTQGDAELVEALYLITPSLQEKMAAVLLTI